MDLMMSPGSYSSAGGYVVLGVSVVVFLMLNAAFHHPLQMRVGYLLVTMGGLIGNIGAMTLDFTAWA